MREHFTLRPDESVRVDPEQLRHTSELLLQSVGVPVEDARQAADVLLYADLRGIDTHGVSNKLRDYLSKYTTGVLNAKPTVQVVQDRPATALLDADSGLGLIVAPHAMRLAIEKARTVGVGLVCVRNAGHVGAAGYYPAMAAKEGMIGLSMAVSHARKGTLPTFGAEPLLGTNPVAMAAPAREEADFVFDAAMTTIAGNKIGLARRMGRPLQPGWIANQDGTPDMVGRALTEDEPTPHQLPLGSTPELGSHKGYGLAMMVDILCGQLSFAPGFAELRADRGGHLVAAFDIAAFGEVDDFRDNMDGMLQRYRTSTPAAGAERVLYPGLPEHETLQERTAAGIPLHTEVIDWFRRACAEHEVPFQLV